MARSTGDKSTHATHQVLFVSDGQAGETWQAARRLSEQLEASRRFSISPVSVTGNGVPALASLTGSGFDIVVLLLGESDALPDAHAQGLADFVKAGGGVVAMQNTVLAAQNQAKLGELLGATVTGRLPAAFEYQISLDEPARAAGHGIVARCDDFTLRDAFVQIEPPADAEVFATAHFSGKPNATGYTRKVGKGRLVYLAHGGRPEALDDPHVRRLVERSLRFVAGETYKTTVRAGILGYGGAFNMGRNHANSINAQHGMETVAVCDLDPARTQQAKEELGEKIRTYNKPEQLLADDRVDMIVGILPHNLHADYCIAASEAGKHTITEKPFCLTLDEADRMIAAADAAGTLLSCYHNRRWDGDFRQLLTLVERGEIGDVFHSDAASGGYGMPRNWWRASKAMSGGVLYDWGAHYIDWLLHFMPRRIASVSGNLQKRYWHNTTNEDFAQINIRFEDGTSATLEQGSLVAIKRPGWRILGTLGGLTNDGPGGDVTMVNHHAGVRREAKLNKWPSTGINYYQNAANHLIMGEPLIVTPVQARRVIGILHLAEQSSEQGGKPLPLPGEDSYTPDYRFPL